MNNRTLAIIVLIVVSLAAAGLYLANRPNQPPKLSALTPVSFATDWKAQAEQGGFYQALAMGFYEARGLDVTIRQGGPGVNIPQLVAAGAVDFGMGSNSFIPLNLVAADAPVKAVMASFQKDPQVLITHPRDDISTIADMSGQPIMISDATISAFWIWLRAKYSFSDKQIRKYTFNLAPFLNDKKAIQQGYLSSEPYTIEKEGGFKPQVFLLADHGYPGYGAFVLVPTDRIENDAKTVQAFVDATIEGWYSYLYGDPALGNALIKADNPEMTDEILAHAIAKLKEYGIVDSGDAQTFGIGAMTDERWTDFFAIMSENGVYNADLDLRQAYTLDFVNKNVAAENRS